MPSRIVEDVHTGRIVSVSVSTEPTTEPIDLDDAVRHCRIDDTSENSYVENLITAARKWCERYTRRSFITQSITAKLDKFPSGVIPLKRAPVQSITSISYTDTDGNSQTWGSSNYTLVADDVSPYIELAYSATYPETRAVSQAVSIVYVAGYGDDDTDVPEDIRQAVRLCVGQWYEHREPVVVGTISAEVPMTVKSLLYPYRLLGG